MNELNQEGSIKEMVSTLMTQASVVVITNDIEYESAVNSLSSIKKVLKSVSAYWEEPVKKARQSWESLTGKRDEMFDPLYMVESKLKIMIGDYRMKKAEEAKRHQDIIRAQLEAKAMAEKEELAKEKAEFGDIEGAKIVSDSPVSVVPVFVDGAPKVKGVGFREDWDFTVEDMDIIPRQYLVVDEKKLRAVAKALKGDAKVPGVSFFKRVVVIAGR